MITDSLEPAAHARERCCTRHSKRNLAVTIFFIVFFSVLSTLYPPASVPRTVKTVIITPGLGSRKIGALLKQEGIIRSKWAFVTYASLRGEASLLKPGTYQFTNETLPRIVSDLVRGGNRERAITIPEGWALPNIAALLSQEGISSGEEFRARTQKIDSPWREKFSFLKELPPDASLEGYLFPDTYRVFTNAHPETILEKMLTNFNEKVTPDMHEEIVRQKKTLFSVITMASLIEKEVVSDEDRAIVSGILWKRLDRGIPLQVDATIAYLKGQGGKISIADTKISSPYNTYIYAGLPKGPIANPGLSAIQAAIHPKSSPYFFYLSAPDGKTIFSRTLEEHNIAKARYLH